MRCDLCGKDAVTFLKYDLMNVWTASPLNGRFTLVSLLQSSLRLWMLFALVFAMSFC